MSDAQRPEWLDLTDEQIESNVQADFGEATGINEGPSVSFSATLLRFAALVVRRFFAVAVRPMARHADPRLATGWYLTLHALAAGAPRRPAQATRGWATVTTIEAGTVLRGTGVLAGGQRFTVDADTFTLPDVPAAVPVTAELPGEAGNVAAGTLVRFDELQQPPPGAIVDLRRHWVTVPGHPADDDERLRERCLAALQVRGEANTPNRYRLAALNTAGVSSVAVARTPRGYGSADLALLVRGRVPTQDQLDLVEANIVAEGLVCRDLWIRAPEVVVLVVEAVITGTVSTREVEIAIERWWQSNIGVGDGVLVQRLYREAAADLPGLDTILFSAPDRNFVARASVWYEPLVTVTYEGTT